MFSIWFQLFTRTHVRLPASGISSATVDESALQLPSSSAPHSCQSASPGICDALSYVTLTSFSSFTPVTGCCVVLFVLTRTVTFSFRPLLDGADTLTVGCFGQLM